MNGMSVDEESTQNPVNGSADALAAGDAAATAGRWSQAVSAWQSALSTGSRDDAIERLRWFIAWRTSETGSQADVKSRLAPAAMALITSAVCGLFATACVFLADTVEGAAQAMLVTLAWGLFTAAGVLSIIYAQRTGHARSGQVGRKELARLCAEATALAQPEVASPTVIPQQGLESQGSGV